MAYAAPDVHFVLAGDPAASPVAGRLHGADKLRPQLTQLFKAFTFNSYDIITLVVEGSNAAVRAKANITSRHHRRDRGHGTRPTSSGQGRPRRFVRPVLRHRNGLQRFRPSRDDATGAAPPEQPAPPSVVAGRRHRRVPSRRRGHLYRRGGRLARGRRGRVRRHRRADRLRQIHPAQCGRRAAGAGGGARSKCSARRSRASTAMPAICSSPMRCFRGRPRSRMSPSGSRSRAGPVAEARARAQQWMGRVGLAGFGARYPHMLSGGQRKRVGLAQVLIRDPRILLMDEPFGPLDAQTRQIMGNLLLDLWSADRKAVLFVTHDLEEAIALSDRVVIMSAGPAARIIGNWKVPCRGRATSPRSSSKKRSRTCTAKSGPSSRSRCSRAMRRRRWSWRTMREMSDAWVTERPARRSAPSPACGGGVDRRRETKAPASK